eukprot:scaffold7235_cov248-Ochromonas_danica.AAC.2
MEAKLAASSTEAPFRMAERVKAKLTADGEYRPGQIVAVHKSGLFDVAFDDQKKPREGLDLGPELIMSEHELHPSESDDHQTEIFKKDDHVEVLREGGSEWRLALVCNVTCNDHGGALYDVIYSDHVREEHVPAVFVRSVFTTDKLPSRPLSSGPAENESKWYMGQTVEARFHGGKVFYPGVISSLAEDGHYVDILYDDGDTEGNVPIEFVRLPGPEEASALMPEAVSASSAVVSVAATYPVGTKVEGNFQGRNKWYPGTVTNVRDVKGSLHYGIKYNDGDSEDNVPEDMIRPLGVKTRSPQQTPPVPSKPASSSGAPRPTPQKSHRRLLDNDEQLADAKVGERNRVNESKLSQSLSLVAEPSDHKTGSGSSGSGSTTSAEMTDEERELLASIRIEANYHGAGTWYPGRILREGEEGFVDVQYDDGEVEENVPVERIRLQSKKPQAVVPTNRPTPSTKVNRGGGFSLNDPVECNYRNSGQFYPGRIQQIHVGEGEKTVYDVLYDDGDKETSVPESRLRLKAVASSNSATKYDNGKGKVRGKAKQQDDLQEAQLALSPGALVEVKDGDKWQLARILHIYYEDEELYNLRLVSSQAVKKRVTIGELRLPRSSSRPNSTISEAQIKSKSQTNGVVVKPEELQALRTLLQQKNTQIHKLRQVLNQAGQKAEALQPSPSKTLTYESSHSSELEGVKAELQSMKKAFGVLAEKFSLVVNEVVQLRQSEEKLRKQVKTQAELLRIIVSKSTA